MTLESAYFISQIIAAILLLASLVFVGIQIRQNTKAVRAASAFEVNRMWGEYNLGIAKGSDEAAFRMKLLDPARGIDDFNEEEIAKARAIYMGLGQLWLSQFRLYQEGSLLREDWEPHGKFAARFYRTPIARFLNEEAMARGHVLPDLAAEVARLDALLDRPTGSHQDQRGR